MMWLTLTMSPWQNAPSRFFKGGGGTLFIRAAYEFCQGRNRAFGGHRAGSRALLRFGSACRRARNLLCEVAPSCSVASVQARSGGLLLPDAAFRRRRAAAFVCHGLVGVYVADCKKWVRLDARGNKAGVNAQFSTEAERLAFPVRTEKGEKDSRIIYPAPDAKIVHALRSSETRTELWRALPSELAYVTVEQ